jgi:hypothetical protein
VGTSEGVHEMGLTLPSLVKYNNFSTDDDFLNALYQYFKKDFIESKPCYKGNALKLKRQPIRDGKESTFYHITTKGNDENNRQIDVPRAERIRWIKPIIESGDKVLKVWKNQRKNEHSILIMHEKENFLIVIRERTGYLLFYTAYYITECYKKKLLNEYKTAPKC